MKYFYSLAIGALTALAAILIHVSLPPYGVALAITGTGSSIWAVGRIVGGRKYKAVASIGWIAVILRAATFGVGNELLVQGDRPGAALVALGTIALITAIALPL